MFMFSMRCTDHTRQIQIWEDPSRLTNALTSSFPRQPPPPIPLPLRATLPDLDPFGSCPVPPMFPSMWPRGWMKMTARGWRPGTVIRRLFSRQGEQCTRLRRGLWPGVWLSDRGRISVRRIRRQKNKVPCTYRTSADYFQVSLFCEVMSNIV